MYREDTTPMSRLRVGYDTFVMTCSALGGVVGSSKFAYDSRHQGYGNMFGSAVLGACIGILSGAVVSATSPITIPGVLIGTGWSATDRGTKKLICEMNHFVAGPHGYRTESEAPPSNASSTPTAS